MPKKISDLTAKTTLNNTDSFVLSDGVLGSDRRITKDDLVNALDMASIEYVDDKASLLAADIEAASKGIKPFETKALMDAFTPGVDDSKIAQVMNDPTPINNGEYRWDGTIWVKRADFYANEVDPDNTSNAVTGKAVGDYTSPILALALLGDTQEVKKGANDGIDNIPDYIILGWALSIESGISNPEYDSNGNIISADLFWPDGVEGTISHVVVGIDGINSIRYNRPDEYIKRTYIYENGSFQSQNFELIKN